MDSTFFAPQWVMVCFLNAGFDKNMSTFIFDQFLAYGVAPLISFGLAILELHKSLFTKNQIDNIMHVLSNPGGSPHMIYKEKVNLAWNKHFIKSSLYNKMLKEAIIEKEYQKK